MNSENKIYYGYDEIGRSSIDDLCYGLDGWKDIIKRLVHDLFELGWDGHLLQIKEKFGELRFYIGQGSIAIFDRIESATNESLKTCMDCGAVGKLRGTGWLVTLCDEHAETEN